MRYVTDLRTAYKAYWEANSLRETQAAYHEILLYGGVDGYRDLGWRTAVVRALRRLALWLERDR